MKRGMMVDKLAKLMALQRFLIFKLKKPKKGIPFGGAERQVKFLPRPDTVKALPKFAPRGVPGSIVGYRLHNGGKWTRDYLVFPVRYFDGYDYDRPRSLLELVPVTT